jgi:hypothetical protein
VPQFVQLRIIGQGPRLHLPGRALETPSLRCNTAMSKSLSRSTCSTAAVRLASVTNRMEEACAVTDDMVVRGWPMRRFQEVRSIKTKVAGGSLAICVQNYGLSFALDLGWGSTLCHVLVATRTLRRELPYTPSSGRRKRPCGTGNARSTTPESNIEGPTEPAVGASDCSVNASAARAERPGGHLPLLCLAWRWLLKNSRFLVGRRGHSIRSRGLRTGCGG